MNFSVWLRLGRVSNLPTVWSNVLAALALSRATVSFSFVTALTASMSVAYVGGMYLNDAFDRKIDARERPNRPIPSGVVTAATVFGIGFGLLALSVAGVTWTARAFNTEGAWLATVSSFALSATIIGYDLFHKGNPLSPVLMGLCRSLVYVTIGITAGSTLSPALGLGALGILCHIVGLTYAAKQENLAELRGVWPLGFLAVGPFAGLYMGGSTPLVWLAWCGLVGYGVYSVRWLFKGQPGSIPGAVVRLIAAVSLLDTLFVIGAGDTLLAGACVVCFGLTRLAQRVIPGT